MGSLSFNLRIVGLWLGTVFVVLTPPACSPAPLPASQPSTAPADQPTALIQAGPHGPVEVYVRQGPQAGPTVMVIAGLHGNEPAGMAAADNLKRLKIRRGKLVLIPLANPPAQKANRRTIPGAAKDEGNLNRNFPLKAADAPKGPLATGIWDFTRGLRPDWVIDLHEAMFVRRQIAASIGSTIIATSRPNAAPAAQRMVAAVNATIDDPNRHFTLLRSPITGGIARSAGDILGSRSVIIETTWTGQDLAVRVAQHETVVKTLLRELKMIDAERAE